MSTQDKQFNLVDTIKNLGFPIVVSLGALWTIYDTQDKIREDFLYREERLFRQNEEFRKSLDSFNETLKTIDNRLGVIENEQ